MSVTLTNKGRDNVMPNMFSRRKKMTAPIVPKVPGAIGAYPKPITVAMAL